MKKRIKKLVSFLMAGVMVLGLQGVTAMAGEKALPAEAGQMSVETAAGNSKVVNMKKSSKNVYVYDGVEEDYNTTVYHKIVIKKPGVLTVQGVSFSSLGSRFGMYVTLCNNKKKSLESGSGSYVSDSSNVIYGVKKGTYYIKVSGYQYYRVAAGIKAMADKGGASKAKAVTLPRKKNVSGILAAGEKAKKADWFKFRLSRSQKLTLLLKNYSKGTITFKLYGPSCPAAGYGGTLYGGNVKSFKIVNMLTRQPINVKAGTYYIKVTRASGSGKTSGAYTVKWN